MSGLLALLDDVAGIAKVAAASIDDVAAQAVKAGAKAAGAVIDDAAVTPKYVHGFDAARELPIIWRIAKGSFKNKLLFLLPIGMLLTSFAPWLISPLLMLGGAYLCFEGAEKVFHLFVPKHPPEQTAGMAAKGSAHLEEQKATGAIKTDFILSAEIMTITLAEIPPGTIWMEAATLALVGIGITVVVYGSVALIVKADDLGLLMCRKGRLGLTRSFGRGLVKFMPWFLKTLTAVGTAAMLWVGGSIIIHGVGEMGWHMPYDGIHHVAEAASQAINGPAAAIQWVVTAALDGVFGLALGLLLIPVATWVIGPIWSLVMPGGKKNSAH